MRLKILTINGFKSFARKTVLEFSHPIIGIVGPNGSGKSNIVEAFRFVLGEQSIKSMRGQSGSDLIFNGSKNLPRSSFASVSICFDNADKAFKLVNILGPDVNFNYDYVTITREIAHNNISKYILNKAEVRLKDLHYLLASVNISSYGHHIISQGDADNILNSNPRDLREIVEGTLGLKIYQYQLKESKQKLEKTKINIQEVSLLRRENTPHLNFLKKQIEKFEKIKIIKDELLEICKNYFEKENIYLKKRKHNILAEKNRISKELENIKKLLKQEENVFDETSNNFDINKNLKDVNNELLLAEKKISEIRIEKNELLHKVGKIEGLIESKEKLKFSSRCPLCGSEIINTNLEQNKNRQIIENELIEFKNSLKIINLKIDDNILREKDTIKNIEKLKNEIYVFEKEREAKREKLQEEQSNLKIKEQELFSMLKISALEEESLSREESEFVNEIKECSVLIDSNLLSNLNDTDISNYSLDNIDRNLQSDLKKKIEKLKIKLEDTSPGNEQEVRKEFEEVSSRDNFLEKELNDLSKSIESLNYSIIDLKKKLDTEFNDGIKKINIEFNNFLSLIFPGASGDLSIYKRQIKEDEEKSEEGGEEEKEEGLELNISFTHKKIKELHSLSGGERSLTSIALLFAMSQVNPPPFLVLDETDAALDESNSRKLGVLLEKLSKKLQLIVITHNRETMSHAGILYGITMDSSSASKLLSIQLKEAENMIQ